MVSKDAAGMGFVSECECLVLFSDAFYFGDGCGVAVHAEEGVGEDPGHAVALSVGFEKLFECLGVSVWVDEGLSARKFASVDDASVV